MNARNIERFGTTRRYSGCGRPRQHRLSGRSPAVTQRRHRRPDREVLASIDRLLAQAGSDKSRLLMVTIYLTDMRDYPAMNEVWDEWVPEGTAPVRACVEAKLANAAYRVEMVVTAAR